MGCESGWCKGAVVAREVKFTLLTVASVMIAQRAKKVECSVYCMQVVRDKQRSSNRQSGSEVKIPPKRRLAS